MRAAAPPRREGDDQGPRRRSPLGEHQPGSEIRCDAADWTLSAIRSASDVGMPRVLKYRTSARRVISMAASRCG
jgi:hypothetical protein